MLIRGSSADEVGQGIFKINVEKKMLSLSMTRLLCFSSALCIGDQVGDSVRIMLSWKIF